jgi:sugar (pentulose or hexulose) kinase
MSGAGRIAIVDVGKSSTKLCVADDRGAVLEERKTASRVIAGPPYPHLDVEGAIAWILEGLGDLARRWPIEVVVPVAHGAAAALLAGDELALPVMDYEFDGPDELAGSYPAPPFEETLSPPLPAGLNLGRQLHWQAERMPGAFARITDILPYAQYIGWRLAGRKVSEVTSLGCHTDLWSPRARTFSSLANARGWDALFAPIEPAWAQLGALRPDVRAATGLAPECRVLVGIHDSNASYFPHRVARQPPFSVVSTGTWVVSMAAGASIDRLDAAEGVLANVDVFGDPVPTSRFMGGRELEKTGGVDLREILEEDVQRVVDRPGETWSEHSRERAALALLHCALKTDRCLDIIGATGPCIVEGSFVRTPAFAAVLAAVRKGDVLVSEETSGTTSGAVALARWPAANASMTAKSCHAAEVGGLDRYRTHWRRELFPD